MIRIFATAALTLALAIAAPAFGQAAHGGTGGYSPSDMGGIYGTDVHMPSGMGGIYGTDLSTVGTSVTISTAATAITRTTTAPRLKHHAAISPLYRNGLTIARQPRVGLANRINGTVGQQAVSGVTEARSIRGLSQGPLNQRPGVDRP